MLDGSGLSLVDVAKRALAGRSALDRKTLATAADLFLLELVRNKARPSSVRWYENKLSALLAALGNLYLDDITRADILACVQAQGVSEATQASYCRAIRAVWRWALRQEPAMVALDVTEGLPTSTRHRENVSPGILTVADAARIMAGADRFRSALALLLFAGIRPQEIWGVDKPPLLWRHILPEEKLIRVPAEVAKTRKPRLIEGLPPTVWVWLQPGPADQPVCHASSQWLIRSAQLAGGFSRKEGGQHCVLRPWPHDATRHSFATYALALTGDPGRVSLWLGHEGNPRMLYTHYRGLATKAEAERYFAIRPALPA